jgi:alpha-tubulin suppressor-like RCC1 family protein
VIKGGGVRCWGAADFGQLGDGTKNESAAPVSVQGVTDAVAVALGSLHSCALLAGGGAKCWGRNDGGQLGVATPAESASPVAVDGLADGARIACGSAHTCALSKSGSVRCFGNNAAGQLGEASAITGARWLTAGQQHTCALLSAGGARCWGDDGASQLGDGTTGGGAKPVEVKGLPAGADALAEIAGGNLHTCALLATGAIKCWGDDTYGTLGNDSIQSSPSPVDVVGFP